MHQFIIILSVMNVYDCMILRLNFFLSEMYSASSISSNKTGTDMASVLQERLSKAVKDEVPGTGPYPVALSVQMACWCFPNC